MHRGEIQDPSGRKPRLGLRGQTLITLAAIIVTLLLTVGLIALWSLERALTRDARERADVVADVAAALLSTVVDPARPLPTGVNRQRVLSQLRRLKQQPGVVEVLVVRPGGERITLGRSGLAVTPAKDRDLAAALAGRPRDTTRRGSPPGAAASGDLLVAYRPLHLAGSQSAALRVVVSPDTLVEARLAPARWIIIVLAIVDGVLLLIFGASFLSRRIIGPIRGLERASAQVAAGDLDHHVLVDARSDDEITRLSRRFNDMVDSLKAKDQTLQRQLEELQAKQREVDQSWDVLLRSAKLASVGRLAAGVAHELGNPMASILGYLELLGDPACAHADREKYLARVRSELERMDRTIRNLLDTARPSDDAVTSTDLVRVIRQAAELAQHQQRLRNVDIRLRLGELPRVVASARLSQVFVNLLLNAGDAMEARGEVLITAEARGDQVWVTVEDNGPGIPETLRKDLFDPFVTTKPPGEGTGLGLAISQSILQASGGQIRLADPQPARGARFEIGLPIWADDGERPIAGDGKSAQVEPRGGRTG